jgi:hypothetical protein
MQGKVIKEDTTKLFFQFPPHGVAEKRKELVRKLR